MGKREVRLIVAVVIAARIAVGAEPSGLPQSLRVAAIQMRSSRDLEANIGAIKKHLAECAVQGARVVVFPECALTGYFDKEFMQHFTCDQLAAAERQVAEACRANDIYAIVGTPWRQDEKLYN